MIDTRFTIPASTLALLDYYRIFDEIQQYKNEKSYFNISIDRNKLKSILETDGWYELIIPEKQLEIDSIRKIDYATDYAIMALKSYMDKFCKFEQEDGKHHCLNSKKYRLLTIIL